MRGSLSPILAKDRRREGLQKSISEANDAVWVYNRGSLSPILTKAGEVKDCKNQ